MYRQVINISRFLLIDGALVIASIPLLLLLQCRNKKSTFFRNLNKEEILEKTFTPPPEKEKLLELEKLADRQGSGIKFDLIVGDWKFLSVWKKNTDREDYVFSSLLRVFSANLEIKKDISIENPLKFPIITSIQFGFLTIEFSGSGNLKGKQPLLSFFFNLIEFKSGSSILFSRSLDEPKEKEKPFFALIAIEENGKWLSARGPGNGLVLFLKD